jgi:hypothetical protein
MVSPDEIKKIYKEELRQLARKFNLTEQDADRINKVFCYMYDKNCSGVSEHEIYHRLKNE